MNPILMLVGNASSGKSTLADLICNTVNATQVAFADPFKRWIQEIFQIPDENMWGSSEKREQVLPVNLKRAMSCINLYDFNESVMRRVVREKSVEIKNYIQNIPFTGISTRDLLKWIGTLGRDLDKDLWTNYAFQTCFTLLSGGMAYTHKAGLISDPSQKPYHLVVLSDGRFHSEIIKANQLNCSCWKIVGPPKYKLDNHQSEREIEEMSPIYFNKIIRNYSMTDSSKYRSQEKVWHEMTRTLPLAKLIYA